MVQRVLKIFLLVSLLHVFFFWYIFTRSKESDFVYYDIGYDTKDTEKEWIMLEDPSTAPSPDTNSRKGKDNLTLFISFPFNQNITLSE